MQSVVTSSIESFSSEYDNRSINILLSGALNNELTEYDTEHDTWIFKSGSWSFDSNNPNTSNLTGASIVGITVAMKDQQFNSNLDNFISCERMQFTVVLGNNFAKQCEFTITTKSIEDNYAFFGIEPVKLYDAVPSIANIQLYFKSSSEGTTGIDNATFEGYECSATAPIALYLEPITTRQELSVFNPIVNNVSKNVQGTIASNLESVYGSTQLKTTELSEIPDYFFTSIAVQLGRTLGTKNSYISQYDGRKAAFTSESLLLASNSIVTANVESKSINVIETGIDRPFYTIQGFTGSVFPKNTVANTIKSMSVSDMSMDILGFVSKALYVTGSDGTAHVDIQTSTTASVPTLRDIILNKASEAEYRVTEKNIFIKELGKVATTDRYGHIVSIL